MLLPPAANQASGARPPARSAGCFAESDWALFSPRSSEQTSPGACGGSLLVNHACQGGVQPYVNVNASRVCQREHITHVLA